MFTGIIEEVGVIQGLSALGAQQLELTIGCRMVQDDLKRGDSVSVDGVCLTVVAFDAQKVVFQLSAETLKNSLFSARPVGFRVNLERALRLTDRLGGHLVQGHVDARARVLKIQGRGDFFELDFSLPPSIRPYLIHKGSVAINGISLTIAALTDSMFRIAVIPHTYRQTNLAQVQVGEEVHVESDVVARYLERLLPEANRPQESKLSRDFLREHGF